MEKPFPKESWFEASYTYQFGGENDTDPFWHFADKDTWRFKCEGLREPVRFIDGLAKALSDQRAQVLTSAGHTVPVPAPETDPLSWLLSTDAKARNLSVIGGPTSVMLNNACRSESIQRFKVVSTCVEQFLSSSFRAEITLSTILFAITLLYTILGGMRAVLAVDFLQVPLVLLFLPAFVWIGVFSGGEGASVASRLAAKVNFSTPVLFALGGAIINAFAGQFFSLLNIGAVSQVEAQERRRLTNRVGLLTAAVLSLFVLVGLCIEPEGNATGWGALMSRFEAVAQSGGWEQDRG